MIKSIKQLFARFNTQNLEQELYASTIYLKKIIALDKTNKNYSATLVLDPNMII